jgi:hypothetical protein
MALRLGENRCLAQNDYIVTDDGSVLTLTGNYTQECPRDPYKGSFRSLNEKEIIQCKFTQSDDNIIMTTFSGTKTFKRFCEHHAIIRADKQAIAVYCRNCTHVHEILQSGNINKYIIPKAYANFNLTYTEGMLIFPGWPTNEGAYIIYNKTTITLKNIHVAQGGLFFSTCNPVYEKCALVIYNDIDNDRKTTYIVTFKPNIIDPATKDISADIRLG